MATDRPLSTDCLPDFAVAPFGIDNAGIFAAMLPVDALRSCLTTGWVSVFIQISVKTFWLLLFSPHPGTLAKGVKSAGGAVQTLPTSACEVSECVKSCFRALLLLLLPLAPEWELPGRFDSFCMRVLH